MNSYSAEHKNMPAMILLSMFWLSGCAAHSVKTTSVCPPNNLNSRIQNFCEVSPNVLWRGARPTSEDAAWLISHNVGTIVNLELVHDDLLGLGQVRIDNQENYELDYFRVRDWEPLPLLFPSLVDRHVAHFLAIVGQQSKPVYVHCRSGENRTGLMVAAYRVIVEGKNVEDAIMEMKDYHGFWFGVDARYIRGLTDDRREQIRHQVAEWTLRLKRVAKIVCGNGVCDVSDI